MPTDLQPKPPVVGPEGILNSVQGKDGSVTEVRSRIQRSAMWLAIFVGLAIILIVITESVYTMWSIQNLPPMPNDLAGC